MNIIFHVDASLQIGTGHGRELFKRDFAGEILDQYQDLKIVDYGFVWHRDKVFPPDYATCVLA
jgi:hypothetical protein